MSRSVMEEICEEVKTSPVLVYMKGTQEMPRCGFSATTVAVLKEYGVPIRDVNVLEDAEKWSAVKEYSDWPTIPQVYVGGKFLGGCDIIQEMHARGELAPLIEEATR